MNNLNIYSDFRDSHKIEALSKEISHQIGSPLNVMEVCGGHTHVIMRYGLKQILPPELQFLHGPGCPVCVMPKERIDHAVALSRQEGVILTTLGDMMRVPGSKTSLLEERAKGADVRMVYSPLDSIRIAKENPEKRVIYFAIGFETTTPLTAALIEMCLNEKVENLFFHVNHLLVPPALHAIMNSEDVKIDAFIAPGHVSTITGTSIYNDIATLYGVPIVISGFEPVDILQSILMIIDQINSRKASVEIQYRRAVRHDGNPRAQEMVERYFTVRDTFRWRGLGDIPRSGLKIKEEYSHLDAEHIFHDLLSWEPIDDHKSCLCGEILRGKAKPPDCKVFGKGCTPNHPIGACMVSSEGACHAYFKYQSI